MSATNHITGSGSPLDLLRALTDEQLVEQIAYYRECQDRLREEPSDGKPTATGTRSGATPSCRARRMVKKDGSQRA